MAIQSTDCRGHAYGNGTAPRAPGPSTGDQGGGRLGGTGEIPRWPCRGEGDHDLRGAETPFVCEQSYQIPGRLRTVVRCEVKGQKWELVQVLNGEKAAQTINGRAGADHRCRIEGIATGRTLE